jgi:flagellar hook assembly protein FlgD
MRKFLGIALFVIILANVGITRTQAQTPGTLTFSVTTTEPAGNYTGVNVVALWIQDTTGNFVKTKIRYAQSRIQYLTKWITASNYNVVDAVTGPTRSNQGTLSFTWNATNAAGAVVNDGYYRVYIQMSDANNAGTWTYVQFKKDTNALDLTPANSGYFTNMSLHWNPTIGIAEDAGKSLQFNCSPNPISGKGVITYNLSKPGDVTIALVDMTGKTVSVLCDENQSGGNHSLAWNTDEISKITSGIYFLRINTGDAIATKKIIINR